MEVALLTVVAVADKVVRLEEVCTKQNALLASMRETIPGLKRELDTLGAAVQMERARCEEIARAKSAVERELDRAKSTASAEEIKSLKDFIEVLQCELNVRVAAEKKLRSELATGAKEIEQCKLEKELLVVSCLVGLCIQLKRSAWTENSATAKASA